jgi:hypothetical protein
MDEGLSSIFYGMKKVLMHKFNSFATANTSF